MCNAMPSHKQIADVLNPQAEHPVPNTPVTN
jgi:hypothetical protein